MGSRLIVLALIVIAAAAGAYWVSRPEPPPPIVGVVRATEVRIAPEVSAMLTAIKVHKGDPVRAGEVVAELSAIEITASVGQARAALGFRNRRPQQRLLGVRAEQIASLKSEIAKAKARQQYVEQQLSRTATLARTDNASQQSLDQAQNDAASARADVAEAKANYDAAVAGPTKEERAIADAQVKAAASALDVLQRRLDKTVLRAPADGVVSVVVAEVGENIHPGQPVLVIAETGKQWLSFNAREDALQGLTVGSKSRRRMGGRQQTDAGDRHRADAARVVRDLASRAGRRRSRPQHGSAAARSAGRSSEARARHDGLARSLKHIVFRRHHTCVMAGLVPAIPLNLLRPCQMNRDPRVKPAGDASVAPSAGHYRF